MMTQNDLEAVCGGLANYIGAIQSVVDLDGFDKNRYVVGVLMDEAVKASQVTPNSQYCSPYILNPMFSTVQNVLKQQIQMLGLQEQTEETKRRIVRYKAIVQEFDNLIEISMKEPQVKGAVA